MCFAPKRRAIFHIRTSKSDPRPSVFYILTWKCASRQSGVRFFHIRTSKSDPRPSVFYILTWKCASRQSGVRFFHIRTSKSDPRPSIFYILTWKCASRHNGVQFFISHLATCLRTRRFSEPTFRPSRPTSHWKKHSVSRLS